MHKGLTTGDAFEEEEEDDVNWDSDGEDGSPRPAATLPLAILPTCPSHHPS